MISAINLRINVLMALGTPCARPTTVQCAPELADGDWDLAGANRKHEWVRNTLTDPMEVTSPAVAAQIAGEPEMMTVTDLAENNENSK